MELSFANNAVNFHRIRAGDLVWRTHSPDLDRAVRPFIDPASPVAKQALTVHVTAAAGEPLRICWTLPTGVSVVVDSPAPLGRAQNRGLSRRSAERAIGTAREHAYELSALTAEISGSVFAPASLLNQLRRQAVEQLQELQSRAPIRRIHPAPELRRGTPPPTAASAQLHLLVRNPEQLAAALAVQPDSITLDYLDLYGLRPSVEQVKAAGIPVRVATPRVLKPGESRILPFW